MDQPLRQGSLNLVKAFLIQGISNNNNDIKQANVADILAEAVPVKIKYFDKTKNNHKTVRRSLTWPEWSDAELNAEKWDPPTVKGQKDIKKERKASITSFSLFDDPEGLIILPSSLKVASWKRISELFTEDGKLQQEPIIVPETDGDFEFIQPNVHLFTSEFMRTLIGQIVNLMELNKIRPIIPETIETIMIPTESMPWRPWHHVYCNCKAGKISHKPSYNIYGKFVVRLYCMGFWRKFVVDDLIPIDAENRILLPTTGNKHEIWPMILFKAFLKIGALEFLNVSSTEIETFNAVTALTGWIPEHRQIYKSLPQDLWSVLTRCLPKYKWPDKQKNLDDEKAKVPKKLRKITDSKRPSSRLSKPNLKLTVSQPVIENDDTLYNSNLVMCAFVLFHSNDGLSKAKEELIGIDRILKNYDMCLSLSHTVFLTQIRDCPLDPFEESQEIPRYKLIRRELWDPAYLARKKSLHEKLQFIGIQPVASWTQYQGFVESEYKDPLEDLRRERVSKVLKTLADYMATPDEHLPVLNIDDSPPTSIRKQTFEENKTMWFSLKDFCRCFRSIVIFHNVTAYNFYCKAVDRRMIQAETLTKDKKNIKEGTTYQIVPLQAGIPMFLLSDFLSSKMLYLCIASVNDIYLEIDPSQLENYDFNLSNKASLISRIPRKAEILYSGTLQLEEYSFKIMMHNFVVLTLKSAYCKAIGLSLPPGRTVFRITTGSSNGSILHIWSSSQIFYGDEELILPKLTTESIRFSATANKIFTLLKECLSCYDNPFSFAMSMMKLREAMFPQSTRTTLSNSEISRIFNLTFYSLLEANIEKTYGVDIFFVARCFTLDEDTTEIFQFFKYSDFKIGQRRQSSITQNISQLRKLRDKYIKRIPKEPVSISPGEFPVLERHELNVVLKNVQLIQRLVRRRRAMKMIKSRKAGTALNNLVTIHLLKILGLIEKSPEENANYFLRSLIQLSPACDISFPFCKDEDHRISYQEFNGVIPSLLPNSWMIVFRDIFYCRKEVELVPRLYSEHTSCTVTIVNNDNLEITPTLFLKTQHHRYVPNNGGYTVLVDASSKDCVSQECRWRLLMITSPGADIQYASDDNLSSSVAIKEIVEYYVPNKDNVVARFNISCCAESLISIQYFASNPKVTFTVSLYRNDEIIQTVTKRGTVVFPAVLLKFDGSDDQRSTYSKNMDINKLQLEVKMLHDPWTVSPDDIPFLTKLQLKERGDNVVIEEQTSKQSMISDKPGHRGKSKGKTTPEPKSDNGLADGFDFTKPHYIIRVAVDATVMDYVEVKKDTGHLEELRAMKRAWEEADPGRGKRALEARRSFLLKFADLPPLEEDPDSYRRAFDCRLLHDIRSIRQRPSPTEKCLSPKKSVISFPPDVLPPNPITIIPLKLMDFQKFVRSAEIQRLETALEEIHLGSRSEAFEKYHQFCRQRRKRRLFTASIRNTEKQILIDRSENHMKDRLARLKVTLEYHEEQSKRQLEALTDSRPPSRKSSKRST